MSSRTLLWTQSSDTRHELRDGDSVVATLTVQGMSQSSASADTASGSWTLRKEGVLRVKILITADGSGAPIGEFAKVDKKHRLIISDGRDYPWAKDRSGTRFETSAGTPVVSFSLKDKVTKVAGTSEIVDDSVGAEDLHLLLVTGWYHMLLTKSDDDATMIGALAAI